VIGLQIRSLRTLSTLLFPPFSQRATSKRHSIASVGSLAARSRANGGGRGIELKIIGTAKPLQFVGMSGRDDFYEALVEMSRLNDGDC